MAFLKQVENAGTNAFNKQISSFGEQSISGNNLKFTYCDLTDTSIRPFGNLFASFNLPITNDQKLSFATQFSNTALGYFNNINQIIVAEIPQNTYGELIDGKTFKLSFPINSGSSVSVVDCYATYFIEVDNTDTKIFDKRYADARPESGYFGIEPESNELKSSNIAYLFSNQVAKPKIGLSYQTVLSSSITYTTSFTNTTTYGTIFTDVTVGYNFIQGKNYKITIKNIKNQTGSYETSDKILFYDKSIPVTPRFNATIGTNFFNFQDKDQSTLEYDPITLRTIRSFVFNCVTNTSELKLHSQAVNSKDNTAFLSDIIIEEIITEVGNWNRWTTSNKFIPSLGSTAGKQPARFSSPDGFLYDQPIGILYLDKGFAVITDQNLVSSFAFNYSGATSSGYDNVTSGSRYTGNTNFTQIYFSDATKSNAIYNSIYTEFIQSVTCIAMPNEFYISNNPTFVEVYGQNGENNVTNDPVYISEVGLYNQYGEMIAIAKLSEPIPKDKFNLAAFNIQLKL